MKTDMDCGGIPTVLTASFLGRTSHAAAAPDLGRSAFDGLLMAVWGIEMMQKHMPEGSTIDYSIVSSGNMPCNIVPDQAVGVITIRACKEDRLSWIKARLEDIVLGAAMATGTKSRLELS